MNDKNTFLIFVTRQSQYPVVNRFLIFNDMTPEAFLIDLTYYLSEDII